MKPGFDAVLNGKKISTHVLQSEHIRATITNYGARILDLFTNSKQQKEVNVIFGYNSFDEYLNTKEIYHGAVIGRYANRIAKGAFMLNGKQYTLECNNGANHLHGGPSGFHQQVWDVLMVEKEKITLKYISEDGEEGYPGRLEVTVIYTLSGNELAIEYYAVSDKDTIINLTNHAYFNLNGIGSGKVLDHLLQIHADRFTPVDETLIPTGVLEPVAYTPYDFRNPVMIGKGINADHPQIQIGNGYDHNFVLNHQDGNLEVAAKAIGDASGVVLEVLTTEPGVQLYVDDERQLFCLETQHFPDAPNKPHFPSVILKDGDTFKSKTIFRFSLEG
jgi:aldose 1-epimerase